MRDFIWALFWSESGLFMSPHFKSLLDFIDLKTNSSVFFAMLIIFITLHLFVGSYILWGIAIDRHYWSRKFEEEFNLNFYFRQKYTVFQALKKLFKIEFFYGLSVLRLLAIFILTFRTALKGVKNV